MTVVSRVPILHSLVRWLRFIFLDCANDIHAAIILADSLFLPRKNGCPMLSERANCEKRDTGTPRSTLTTVPWYTEAHLDSVAHFEPSRRVKEKRH